MNWLSIVLNVIGIAIFFINRFFGRKDKSVPADAGYWMRDNWQEASTTLLLNAAFMLILFQLTKTNSIETLFAKLPDWVTFLGVPGICFALGLGLSWTLYELFKSKKDSVKG